MKRIATLFSLAMFTVGVFGQALSGVGWVNWTAEPDYADITGYAENPYDNPMVIIPMAPVTLPMDLIADAATFDLAWGMLGDAHNLDKLITAVENGDPNDLDGDMTFGAQWKGVHDGANLYIFTKYYDTNAQMDAGTQNYEIMVQPTSHFRHEPSFQAAADSAEAVRVSYENMAYARFVELGGGKAVFKDGVVSEYAASIGLTKSYHAGRTYWQGAWGGNDHGLEGLATATHFWDLTDGVIRAITVFSFDGALGYPTDPTDLGGDYTAVKVKDTISFDIKSRGTIAAANVEYSWASDRNNGYASIYYAGHLVLAPAPAEPGDVAMAGVSWVAWELEPDYPDVTGYAENPYDKATADILQAPDAWTYESITDAATFDATWDILGDAMNMDKLVSDAANGDINDLDGDMTFGAQWKGVHDGANLYIFTKYYDTNAQLDAGSHNYEIMVQPSSTDRHENSFLAASDSAADFVGVYQNMAYARCVELGGGKALFKDGAVSEYAASIGLNKTTFWKGWAAGAWGGNDHGLEGLAMATHFWDVTDGVIRGITVFSFDGALGYPVMPDDMEGDYNAVEVGDVISFDIKSRGTMGEGINIEYHWSSDKNNCYASTYYAGNITLKAEKIVVEGIKDHFQSNVKVFIYNDQLNLRGVESANVNIYSITGSMVKSARNVSGTLDLSELVDGVYFIKLEGIPSGFKVVK